MHIAVKSGVKRADSRVGTRSGLVYNEHPHPLKQCCVADADRWSFTALSLYISSLIDVLQRQSVSIWPVWLYININFHHRYPYYHYYYCVCLCFPSASSLLLCYISFIMWAPGVLCSYRSCSQKGDALVAWKRNRIKKQKVWMQQSPCRTASEAPSLVWYTYSRCQFNCL